MSKQHVPVLHLLVLYCSYTCMVLYCTCTCSGTIIVIWYLRSSGTHTPSHPVPEGLQSSGTCAHPVPTFLVPVFICHMCSSGTNILQASGTRYSSKIWNASRGKSGTWVLSRTTSTCKMCVIIHPDHMCGPPSQGE
jgi:hypothetical protein